MAAVAAMVVPCFAEKNLEPASGTYTDVLRKAAEAGKPVMLYFWNDNPECARQWAQMEKIPYMVVVGEKDMAARVVSPRTREGQQLPAMPIDDLVARLVAEAKVPALD